MNISTLGDPKYFNQSRKVNYSRFNYRIVVQRSSKVSGVLKLIPVILLCIAALYTLRMSSGRIGRRVSISLGAFLGMAGYHFLLSSRFPVEYMMIPEYGIFLGYGLSILAIFVGIRAYNKSLSQELRP
jgi:hypothetical protein